MKVYLSGYRNHWLSPYRIAEKLCWWREIDYDEPWVVTCNKILDPIMSIIMKILDTLHPRVRYIKIDKYDTWNMDGTLAMIILPMLKQIKVDKHGYPSKLTERQWDYRLDEMIWAFEQLNGDDCNDSQFWIEHGELDWTGEPDENGLSAIRWVKEAKVDWVGLKKHHARIDRAMLYFGRHFRDLWD